MFVLRTPDDANAIVKAATDKNVVVCGASFIGMEVASCLVSKAKKLSVCEFFSVPFERILGKEVNLGAYSVNDSIIIYNVLALHIAAFHSKFKTLLQISLQMLILLKNPLTGSLLFTNLCLMFDII